MRNLVVDQCQLESAPAPPLLPIKSFKVLASDHGPATDMMPGSPEESESESEAPSNKRRSKGISFLCVLNFISNLRHYSPHYILKLSVANETPRLHENQPASGEVEDGETNDGSNEVIGMRTSRNRQQHQRAPNKRKFEDLQAPASSTAAGETAGVASSGGLDLDHHHHQTENHNSHPNSNSSNNSNEGAGSIQHMQQQGEHSEHHQHQQQTDSMDAARAWKRLYAGNITDQHNEPVQVFIQYTLTWNGIVNLLNSGCDGRIAIWRGMAGRRILAQMHFSVGMAETNSVQLFSGSVVHRQQPLHLPLLHRRHPLLLLQLPSQYLPFFASFTRAEKASSEPMFTLPLLLPLPVVRVHPAITSLMVVTFF